MSNINQEIKMIKGLMKARFCKSSTYKLSLRLAKLEAKVA